MTKRIDLIIDIAIIIALSILVGIEWITIAEFILGFILMLIYREIKFWREVLEIIIDVLEENDNEIN